MSWLLPPPTSSSVSNTEDLLFTCNDTNIQYRTSDTSVFYTKHTNDNIYNNGDVYKKDDDVYRKNTGIHKKEEHIHKNGTGIPNNDDVCISQCINTNGHIHTNENTNKKGNLNTGEKKSKPNKRKSSDYNTIHINKLIKKIIASTANETLKSTNTHSDNEKLHFNNKIIDENKCNIEKLQDQIHQLQDHIKQLVEYSNNLQVTIQQQTQYTKNNSVKISDLQFQLQQLSIKDIEHIDISNFQLETQ